MYVKNIILLLEIVTYVCLKFRKSYMPQAAWIRVNLWGTDHCIMGTSVNTSATTVREIDTGLSEHWEVLA